MRKKTNPGPDLPLLQVIQGYLGVGNETIGKYLPLSNKIVYIFHLLHFWPNHKFIPLLSERWRESPT